VQLDLSREITLRLSTANGILKIESDDVPGFRMVGVNHDAIFSDLPEVLHDLIQHNGLKYGSKDMLAVPDGMIVRVDRSTHFTMPFVATIGFPTQKGNFSSALGKWAGMGGTEDEAIQNVLDRRDGKIR